MKAKLIIFNWLFSWVPLCYAGDDPVIAMCVVGWFGFSSWLLNKHKRITMREVDRFENWVDKQLNKQPK